MPKNPYEVIKELYKGQYDRDKSLLEFGHSQTDTLAGWIIGFGIAALSLMISNLEMIHKNFHGAARPLVILLTMSICFGLAYRYVSYHIIILHKRLADYFTGVLSDLEMTPIEVDPGINTTTFDEIILRLKQDFDEVIPYPGPLNDQLKTIELPRLRQHYIALCEHSKKFYDLAIDHWADVNQTAYKISKEVYKKRVAKPNVGFRLRIWALISGSLYLLCLLTFMLAVIVTAVYLYFAL